GSRDLDEQRREITEADRLIPSDVERSAVARICGTRPKERVRRVVDVDEVAKLRSIAVDLNRFALDREADEPADESLTVVFEKLARTVHVGQPQRTGADAEHVVV